MQTCSKIRLHRNMRTALAAHLSLVGWELLSQVEAVRLQGVLTLEVIVSWQPIPILGEAREGLSESGAGAHLCLKAILRHRPCCCHTVA